MSTEVVSAGDVMEFIKARIRAGAFVAGQRLVETDLMQMTGATRSRLREALRAVAYEGLIELHEFKGAVVRGLTHEDARQMWELREVLEGAAARICAQSDVDENFRDQLVALQGKIEEAATSGDVAAFIEYNDDYHAMIVRGCRNDLLVKTVKSLEVTSYRLERQLIYRSEVMKQAAAEHAFVTQAIVARDADAAEQAMRNHVANSFRHLERASERLFQR